MAKSEFVRVKPDAPHSMSAHPETGVLIVPDRSRPYRADDPFVKAYPFYFQTDEEAAEAAEAGARYVTEAPLEQATKNPGQKRNVRKP